MATGGYFRRSRSGLRPGVGGLTVDVASLADLLHETAEHHGLSEAVAPPHDWWDWYAAYMDARERGSTPEEASAAAVGATWRRSSTSSCRARALELERVQVCRYRIADLPGRPQNVRSRAGRSCGAE